MTKNHELISNLLDSFYEKVASEKSTTQKKANETLAAKEKDGTTKEVDPSLGAAGSEMNAAIADYLGGASAPDSAVPTSEDAVVAESADGPNALTADEPINEDDNQVKVTEQQKQARAARIGNAILNHVASLRKQANLVDGMEKRAADAYNSFTAGWMRGFEKKAEDIQAMLESGVAKSAPEAEAVLNQIAQENPAAVLPEEAIDEDAVIAAEAGLEPEQIDALKELADELVAQGVTPEDVTEAAKAIDELQAAGVSPEEIVQAAAELQNEIPAEDAAEKQAAQRRNIIKNYIRGLSR